MGLFARLFGKTKDEHAEVRPLWQAIVALARTPRWYSELGLADTVPGRFDADDQAGIEAVAAVFVGSL